MRVCVWFSAVGTVNEQQVLFCNNQLLSGMGPRQNDLQAQLVATTVGALVNDGIVDELGLPHQTTAWFYDGTATTGEGVTAVFVDL